MVEGAHVSLRVPETRGRALGGGAKWRARVCQGGTLLTGAPAAASGRGWGTWRSARRPLQQRPKHRPSRKRARASSAGADAPACSSSKAGAWRSVSRRKGGARKSRPPRKGLEFYLGQPDVTHCHSRENTRLTSLRTEAVARPLALPTKLFPNDRHSCEYATKEGGSSPLQGRRSANIHLLEGPGRHRSCCYVHARPWRVWSPACEELSRRLASQFGWVRREGEGC